MEISRDELGNVWGALRNIQEALTDLINAVESVLDSHDDDHGNGEV